MEGDDRSCSPASPSASHRSRHLRTVFVSTWNRSAVAFTVDDTPHHPATSLRGQRCIWMLPQACTVFHEPSFELRVVQPTVSQGGLTQISTDHTIPPGTTSPVVTPRAHQRLLSSSDE
jgi:hypothetical protein